MLAQVACIAGFAVLLTGAIISVTRNNDPDKFVTAGLTALGTLLSGFLGATFLHSARRADRRLSLYYQEPHMFGRILVAERLNKVDLSPVAADKLITALLEWPFPIDSDAEAPTKPENGQESGKAPENGAEKPGVAS